MSTDPKGEVVENLSSALKKLREAYDSLSTANYLLQEEVKELNVSFYQKFLDELNSRVMKLESEIKDMQIFLLGDTDNGLTRN